MEKTGQEILQAIQKFLLQYLGENALPALIALGIGLLATALFRRFIIHWLNTVAMDDSGKANSVTKTLLRLLYLFPLLWAFELFSHSNGMAQLEALERWVIQDGLKLLMMAVIGWWIVSVIYKTLAKRLDRESGKENARLTQAWAVAAKSLLCLLYLAPLAWLAFVLVNASDGSRQVIYLSIGFLTLIGGHLAIQCVRTIYKAATELLAQTDFSQDDQDEESRQDLPPTRRHDQRELHAEGHKANGSVNERIRQGATRWLENLLARSDRFKGMDRKLITSLVNSFLWLLYLLPLFWLLDMLFLPAEMSKLIRSAFIAFFTLSFVRFTANLASFVLNTALRGPAETGGKSKKAAALMPIVRTIVWALGITFLLDNLGFQVSSIIAGLGIMGMAVGLAGQTILGDLFGYMVILLDRPFSIGDTVNTGSVTGTVERIGIKTTRIRAITGEVQVCPNGELTKQRIVNYYPAVRRARPLTFGVAYTTPVEKVRAIPEMVRELALNLPGGVTVDRLHFTAFGDSSLTFEGQISVPGRDGVPLLDALQGLQLAIMEKFAAEGIQFTYPVSVVHLAKDADIIIPAA